MKLLIPILCLIYALTSCNENEIAHINIDGAKYKCFIKSHELIEFSLLFLSDSVESSCRNIVSGELYSEKHPYSISYNVIVPSGDIYVPKNMVLIKTGNREINLFTGILDNDNRSIICYNLSDSVFFNIDGSEIVIRDGDRLEKY